MLPYKYRVLPGCGYAYQYDCTHTGYAKNAPGTFYTVSILTGTPQILKIAKVDSRLRKYFACNMTLPLEYPTMKEMLTLYANGIDYHYKPMGRRQLIQITAGNAHSLRNCMPYLQKERDMQRTLLESESGASHAKKRVKRIGGDPSFEELSDYE
ncbi:hypothetical protein TEA_017305 [Camellia sinensis var. sinensis]|uniref:Uncharacterized protein n=1 Tax=Camellia sinensis var. sinensis TaxID=542762 RepID=A0A4S4EEB0_CAMSN|nr:hypothetical protein TEA_017305 [Camellia sinensis var. sinensis]